MTVKIKIIALILCLAVCLSLCGCSPFDMDADAMLQAPKLTGELEPLQKALEKSIPGKYSLKFPETGETKAAITPVDLNMDNENEAVAFYSTSTDNIVTMHIAILDVIDGKWQVANKAKIVAGGVERVYFTDMDGDGIKEIIVGWNVYGAVEKSVSVYTYKKGELVTLLEEPYTTFILCDLDNGFSSDLLTVFLNKNTTSASAKYFDISAKGVTLYGECPLDFNVTAYSEPILARLSDDRNCVYLDCIKGSGLITEILYVEDENLRSPFFDSETGENIITYRPTQVPCRDFDGDGTPDIPIMIEQPLDINQSSSPAYLTVWHTFEGGALVPKYYTLMNYSDGYMLNITKKMSESTVVVRNLDNRERIIYMYDFEEGKFLAELFRIRTVSREAYNMGTYSEGYILLEQSDTQVWLAQIPADSAEIKVTESSIKAMFALIKN